ncbi:PBSX family phage terminase large subunit [Dyella sp. KRB-257]|uniref:PBSX family phage terminase large subunit n=1 Tax=Dyella sp. KRB-257 TaxID=3400915 RepID=UPI003C054A8A
MSSASSSIRIPTARVFRPLLEPSRYKGAHGGRGSGKSHFFAELLVERCALQPGLRAACVREVQKSLKNSVKLLVEDKIRQYGFPGFDILESEIKTPGGGVIIFQGMQNHTADSIKSLEGFDIAWVEEAQSLSQRSLDMLRPTFRKAGSEIWFSWNPNKPDDPVDALLRGEMPPNGAVVVEANWSDNPWLPDELREELEGDRRRDPEKFRHVWGGHYAMNANARVFRNWRVEEFTTPPDAVHRFGADWGFAIDPTVLVRCHVDGRTLYVDAEAWQVGCEIDKTPALFDTIVGSRKWLIRADSARPETVSYMQRQGFRITSALKGPGSLEDGVEFLRSFDIVVHPRCEHVADELASYSYKIDKHTEEILPVLEDKQNHTIDALRYALEELRRSGYKPSAEAKAERRLDDYDVEPEEAYNWKTA